MNACNLRVEPSGNQGVAGRGGEGKVKRGWGLFPHLYFAMR